MYCATIPSAVLAFALMIGSFIVTINALNIVQPQHLNQPMIQQRQTRRDILFSIVAMSPIIAIPTIAYSDTIDDLAMPTTTVDEQKDADAIMAERIQRKIELQKEKAQPKTFTESFQKERMKQQNLNNQSKAERRNAMCEELGRGC